MEAFTKDALSAKQIPMGVHNVRCIKPILTKSGRKTFILVIGDKELSNYWANAYLNKCLQSLEQDIFNAGLAVATLEVMPGDDKYPKCYKFKLIS